MNKQKRNEVYRLMLILYKSRIEHGDYYGFCSILNFPFRHCPEQVSYQSLKEIQELVVEDLPELMLHKPSTFYTFHGEQTSSEEFWFPLMDFQIRINVLENCINQTKDE